MLSAFEWIFTQSNIAVDLGTANTRVYTPAFGRITEKPSIISLINPKEKTPVSDEYISYLNSRFVSMPLRGGVIVDIKNAIALLRPLIKRSVRGLKRPTSLACAPTDTSERERRLLAEAVLNAGASHVAIIPEVWAAAIGAGLDTGLSHAQALIDIGEGVTDMAVIRGGHIIYSSAIRTACSDLQKAVRNSIIKRHRVNLFPSEVERLTHEISSMSRSQPFSGKLITVDGIHIVKRRRVTVEVNSKDIVRAMEPVTHKILSMIGACLQKLPDNVSCEISDSGICLTGGGACIDGIDRLIASRGNLDVRIAPDPIRSVIKGAVQTLQDYEGEKSWWEGIEWPKLAY